MSSRYLAFNFVCVFIFVQVMDVQSCSMIEDPTLKEKEFMRQDAVLTNNFMFTKCVSENKTCTNCVASGFQLVNVTYNVRSSGEILEKVVYVVTGCQCVAKKPLNNIVVEKTPQQIYKERYMVMTYCTYALAAVCAVLGVIIVLLCLRYEKCSSKRKSKKIGREKDEQMKPLAAKSSEQEKV